MERSNRLILLTGSLLLVMIPKVIVKACGFYVAPSEYRFWLLQPDLTNKKDLTPFFFASYYLYRGDQYAGGQPHVATNINEWYKQINGNSSRAEIDTILNHTDPQLFFDRQRQLADRNAFLRYLLRPANSDLYQYLVLSKKVEQIHAHPDPWGETTVSPTVNNQLTAEARALYNRSGSQFIKLRAAYQMIRLNGSKVDELYDSLIAPVKTDSWIKTAALFQKAVKANGTERDYLLSKVFDRGNYNRVTCLVYFNSRNMDSVLKRAKNAHERSVLLAMKVFNYQGKSLQSIRAIYQADPAYKELSFLLLREINKVEDMLVTGKVTHFDPIAYHWNRWDGGPYSKINYANDKTYAAGLYNFIQQVIREDNNSDKSLLHLYASHLAMIRGEYEISRQHLNAASTKGLPVNVQTQLRINKLLLDLYTSKQIGVAGENELISILQLPDKQSGVYDPGIMKDQLILFAARKMIEKGDKAKGLMLLSKTHRALGELPIGNYKRVYQEIEETAAPADYDKILAILNKNGKSAFEKFISQGPFNSPDYYGGEPLPLTWDTNKLLDGKASWYIRNNQLEAAFSVLQQLPAGYWKKAPYDDYVTGDPFYLNIYHAQEVTKEDKLRCNKKEVIGRMLGLLSKARLEPAKAADCYYQLANAWYNMSYYGKNWLMVKQWWSINEKGLYSEIKRTSFTDTYYGCTRAKEYYLKALQQTKDKKLASLCTFMAGVCNRHFQEYVQPSKDHEFPLQPNPYMKNLKQKGMDDAYYNQLVKECATYIDFIRQYHK